MNNETNGDLEQGQSGDNLESMQHKQMHNVDLPTLMNSVSGLDLALDAEDGTGGTSS